MQGRVSPEVLERAKLLCENRQCTLGELLTILITEEWARTAV